MRTFLAIVGLCVTGSACTPGYIKASDLEAKGQGPAACHKSCEDLGMRMTAMVLVGDTLPGCVCQPVVKQQPQPLEAPAAETGAAASTTGYVVVAAAAAAAREQQRQQQLQQQQQQQQQKKN
jgi:hypothetical protein